MVTRCFERPQEFKQRQTNGFLIETRKSNVSYATHVIGSYIGRSDDVRSVEKFNCLNNLRSKSKSTLAKSTLHSRRLTKASFPRR